MNSKPTEVFSIGFESLYVYVFSSLNERKGRPRDKGTRGDAARMGSKLKKKDTTARLTCRPGEVSCDDAFLSNAEWNLFLPPSCL